jgi:hypothetical protein
MFSPRRHNEHGEKNFQRRALRVVVVQFFGVGDANAIVFDFVDMFIRLGRAGGHEKYEKHEDEIP